MTETTWFADWFDQDYLRLYASRDAADARAGVDLLVRALAARPEPPTRLLDLACGPGRHLPGLAAAGLHPVGLDLSPTLLTEATKLTAGGVPLVRGDMRRLPFASQSFDAVAMFFTSFGYFDEVGNSEVLVEIRRVLTDHGALYLDLLNRPNVIANLIPHGARQVDDLEVEERRSWNPTSQRVEKEIEIRSPRGRRRIKESVRLYTTDQVIELCAAAGLDAVPLFGSLNGEPYNPDTSPRLMVRAVPTATTGPYPREQSDD